MLAKILTVTLTAALAFFVARQIKQHSDRAKAHVRTRDNKANDRIVTLREDPETGVFRPVDSD